jgi:hypothetical protein
MATIWFGAQVPIITENGNWNDVNQWYSDPGNSESKSYRAGVLLGRLPLMTDTCIFAQSVTSGVAARVFAITGVNNGVWTGDLNVDEDQGANNNAGVNDPGATWSGTFGANFYLNIGSGVVNFNCNRAKLISGGTINGTVSYPAIITGGTFNGTVSNIDTYVSGGTFNGNVSGSLKIQGNPVFNGSLVNIGLLQIISGTFTKTITSWSGGSIQMLGGTYNAPSTPTAGLTFFYLAAGTMAQNIFTSAYTQLGTVSIQGGTLSFTGDIQVGAPGRQGTLVVNTYNNPYGPRFVGTDKNITVYGSSSSNSILFGSAAPLYDAGTYTGVLTFLPFTGTATPLYTVVGGSYTPPVQILPLINVAYGTGKGISAPSIYQNYGFATFTQRLSVSGSSDILQSELA